MANHQNTFHRKIVFLQHLKKNIKHTRYEQGKDKELRADQRRVRR